MITISLLEFNYFTTMNKFVKLFVNIFAATKPERNAREKNTYTKTGQTRDGEVLVCVSAIYIV